MRPTLAWLLLGVVAVGGTACGGQSEADGGNAATDKLAQIEARGTLILPVDPGYPPASFRVSGAARSADTRCAENQLTAPEVDGYDVATGEALAEALDVEPCFVTPTWSELLGGNWSDRWDIAFSSIGITSGRMHELYFTKPYYATPERFYVRRDGPIKRIDQLEGSRIGVCAGCFADLYLRHQLDLPGSTVQYKLNTPLIVGYAVERDGLDDVGHGTLDAFLCQETAGDEAIAQGVHLRPLAPPAYEAYIGGALDRAATLELTAFFNRVNEVITDLHQSGRLRELSVKYFGKDYARDADEFSLESIEQSVD